VPVCWVTLIAWLLAWIVQQATQYRVQVWTCVYQPHLQHYNELFAFFTYAEKDSILWILFSICKPKRPPVLIYLILSALIFVTGNVRNFCFIKNTVFMSLRQSLCIIMARENASSIYLWRAFSIFVCRELFFLIVEKTNFLFALFWRGYDDIPYHVHWTELILARDLQILNHLIKIDNYGFLGICTQTARCFFEFLTKIVAFRVGAWRKICFYYLLQELVGIIE
jgi:hypothetical protein